MKIVQTRPLSDSEMYPERTIAQWEQYRTQLVHQSVKMNGRRSVYAFCGAVLVVFVLAFALRFAWTACAITVPILICVFVLEHRAVDAYNKLRREQEHANREIDRLIEEIHRARLDEISSQTSRLEQHIRQQMRTERPFWIPCVSTSPEDDLPS